MCVVVVAAQSAAAPCVPMTSEDAAKAVFPALARPLQKFLRVTRQQPRHSAEQVNINITCYIIYTMNDVFY